MFGSKRALIWLQIAVLKTRAGLGVERKSLEVAGKAVLRAGETKKNPKKCTCKAQMA